MSRTRDPSTRPAGHGLPGVAIVVFGAFVVAWLLGLRRMFRRRSSTDPAMMRRPSDGAEG